MDTVVRGPFIPPPIVQEPNHFPLNYNLHIPKQETSPKRLEMAKEALMMDRLIRPPIQNMQIEKMPEEPFKIDKPMESFFSSRYDQNDEGPIMEKPMQKFIIEEEPQQLVI